MMLVSIAFFFNDKVGLVCLVKGSNPLISTFYSKEEGPGGKGGTTVGSDNNIKYYLNKSG